MDILSGGRAFTWIIDKFIERYKLGKTKKEDSENKEIIRSRLRSIFSEHKNEIEILFIELLDEMKSEILKNDNDKNSLFLNKIEEIKKGDLIENIDKTTNDIENNKGITLIWRMFFYDDKIKGIQNDLNINLDKFLDVYFREAKNYFESGKEADTKLLLNEKKEKLKMLEKSMYEFEKIMLEKFEGLVKLSIINSINSNSSINDDKITSMIKNVDKFARDIKKGKMKKYYLRIFSILNCMIDEMIEKIKK